MIQIKLGGSQIKNTSNIGGKYFKTRNYKSWIDGMSVKKLLICYFFINNTEFTSVQNTIGVAAYI